MCREYSLSAAYDIVPTNLILPEDEEEMALTVNGKKKNITNAIVEYFEIFKAFSSNEFNCLILQYTDYRL